MKSNSTPSTNLHRICWFNVSLSFSMAASAMSSPTMMSTEGLSNCNCLSSVQPDWRLQLPGRNNNHVEVGFALTAAEFQEAKPIVEVTFGMREPDCDAQDFDGALSQVAPLK
ncbi:MAG: hypothetical protein ABI831_07170 [Betaproteobacteria bacterium]